MMILNGEVSTSKEDKPVNDFNASEDYSTSPAYVVGLERRVDELEAALGRAIAVIEAVEYTWDLNEEVLLCPWCEAWQYHEPHKPDCPREAALAERRGVMGG